MASSGSQWDQEAADQPNDSYEDDNLQEPAMETWLLMEYCDKGSLLVCLPACPHALYYQKF